jgi:hypothetical protein
VTRALTAGMAVILIVAFLPVIALTQETSAPISDQAEYVPGEVDEEIVGGLRLSMGKHYRSQWRATRWVNMLEGQGQSLRRLGDALQQIPRGDIGPRPGDVDLPGPGRRDSL